MDGPIRRIDHATPVRNDPRQEQRRREGGDRTEGEGEARPDAVPERPHEPGNASLGHPLDEEGGGRVDLTA